MLIWVKFDAPNSLSNEASGGIRTIIGNSQTAFNAWTHLGSDSYAYGGWTCLATNDTVSPDYTAGSPSGPWQRFGAAYNCPTSVPSKGNPFGVDCCRVGRCEARFSGGDLANGYCTFAGFAVVNDNVSYRWGLIQAIAGGYLWQGLLVLGYGSAVDFRDSNTNITIANTKKVTANFNTVEVRNASSRIEWSSISFTALGTVSPGRWVTTDDATVLLDACTFIAMGTFDFKSNASLTGCTFRRCQAITLTSAHFLGCVVANSQAAANASALIWNVATNPDGYLDGSEFTRGTTANHAIEFGVNSPLSMQLTDVVFSGYNAANNQNDSAIHIKRTEGTVTVSIVGGTAPSYRTDGATVNIVTGQVTFSFTVQNVSGSPVTGYEWRLYVDSGVPGEIGTDELAGEESATGSSQSYQYSYTTDTDVILQILHDDYVEYEWSGTLTADNQDIGVVLTLEGNV
jgi:hypothetical protein